MRAVIFPSESVVADECAALARMGAAGGLAASWLRGLAHDEVLVARSFALYVGVLRRFAAHAASDTSDPTRPFTAETFADFLADASRSPWRRNLSIAVLRRFVGADTPERFALESALASLAESRDAAHPALPRGEADDSIEATAAIGVRGGTPTRGGRALTAAQLEGVDQEATRVLAAAAQGGDADAVLRAALVAMCRHAGALAGDLAALTFDDLAADRGCVWGDTAFGVGTAWRVLRVRREATGSAKTRVVVLDMPPAARRWVERWLAVRQRAGVLPTGDAPVFFDPDTQRPLDRKDVWRLVAAIGNPKAGTKTAKRLNAAAASSPAGDALGAADASADPPFGERVELSPTLLRHCLALELVRRERGGEALTQAFATRLGAEGTGVSVTRYRRLLNEARPRRGRPKRVASASTD